jgi:hypothetical protein
MGGGRSEGSGVPEWPCDEALSTFVLPRPGVNAMGCRNAWGQREVPREHSPGNEASGSVNALSELRALWGGILMSYTVRSLTGFS